MYNNYNEYERELNVCPYCRQNFYENSYRVMQMPNIDNIEIEDCYPEIYKIVKPMVRSTCQMYLNQRITKEVVEEMTTKIFTNLETQESRGREETQRPLKNGDVINPNAKKENVENRGDRGNYILRDLIKILLINELLNNRPQMPPHPPRPHRVEDMYMQYPRQF